MDEGISAEQLHLTSKNGLQNLLRRVTGMLHLAAVLESAERDRPFLYYFRPP